jgi:UDP-glucose 4-epimerase
MRILVTGGAGFIASHITDAYVAAGHEVTILDNQASAKRENINPKAQVAEVDVSDASAVEGVFGKGRFELVNHHAAQASVSVSVKEPILDARTNIIGAINLLQSCVRHKVGKFVFASSGGTVYGATDRLPATEELPFAASSPYGVSKVTTELYLRVWREQHGLTFTALRYSNVYGPRQDPHGEAGVIAIFSQRMMGGGKPVIFGDGEYLRDYVFVEDIVRANVAALEKGDNEGINIGTGVRTSTNQLFRTMKALTGYPGPEEHGPARAGDLRDSCLDAAKAKRLLGWEPKVGMEEGLRRTVEWFRPRVKKG